MDITDRVRLDGHLGDDLCVVNSARVSFGKRVERMTHVEEGLIKYLMRERHGSPFEHNAFRFWISCPIFVAREWMRHRIGSFNERSGRYSELEREFYVPVTEDVRSQVGRPGAYRFEPIDPRVAGHAKRLMYEACADAFDAYYRLLDQGVAKEVARMVLPVNTYTEFYWTVNARSLMNFLSLRNAETAQLEIQVYARAVEALWAAEMPVTYEAFVANDRTAP